MATLVLTAVGTAIGGPIGGALGAVLGQAADARLFAPKGRQGPALSDLRVQTSSYGSAIPKLFGRLRVAGTVIWATDLVEHRDKQGGGKGRPSVTTYSYTASFAVALSGRAIRSVGRIWADGKLLRGAAGDWKSACRFRLHLGDEDQPIDPLIAAAETIPETPAYRGTAYAVFEDMDLSDYGNRIPSLTFEVEADAGPVTIGAIGAALSEHVVDASDAAVAGYAASAGTVAGCIEELSALFGVRIEERGDVLALTDRARAAVTLARDELGARVGGETRPRLAVDRGAAGALPEALSVGYFDPVRDHQAGSQRARRGAPGRGEETVELPVALDAGAAKAAAERRLAERWTERRTATVRLPWRWLRLAPGDRVRLPGVAGTWRVAGTTLERMAVELALVAATQAAVGGEAAAPGRAVQEADAAAGATRIELLDLPPLGDTAERSPTIWVAAAGTEPGWRRAALLASRDGSASWAAAGGTALPAVIGSLTAPLDPASAAIVDRRGVLEIELLHDGMMLEGRGADALANGANLALVGDELLQFESVESLGANLYRLRGLWRGRRGSEAAIEPHPAGTRFVLVEQAALAAIALPAAALGGMIEVRASGVGDDVDGVAASCVVSGRALRPPAPVALTAVRLADGTVRIGWTRRSRTGWSWLDGRDAPLGEESERYRVTIAAAGGAGRTVECDAPTIDYDAAAQAADATAGAALTIAVRMLGDWAPSEPATVQLLA